MVGAPASMEEKKLADTCLSDELLDAFDAQGVSNELVILDAKREDKMLKVPEQIDAGNDAVLAKQTSISLQGRYVCLRCMYCLAERLGMPVKLWFDSVALFDAYCIRKSPNDDLSGIPSLCVAMLMLLKKMDSHTVFATVNLAPYTTYVAQSLRSIGFEAPEGSITEQEQALLETLGWQVNLPSIGSWISTFCGRFNILTEGAFVQSMTWVWQQSASDAISLVLRQPICAPIPTRRLARGLVAILLASVRLISFQALTPEELSDSEWLELVVGCYPSCMVPEHASVSPDDEQPLQLLEIALGVDPISLQQDCKLVAMCLRKLRHESARQAPHCQQPSTCTREVCTTSSCQTVVQ